MTKPFRPLLAATIENDQQLDGLAYPMIASPKVDGIRILCHSTLGPVTRSLKPVRNQYIRQILSLPDLKGLDGEIVMGPIAADNVFNRTTTAVMTIEGQQQGWRYHVFDDFRIGNEAMYDLRLETATIRVDALQFDFVKTLTSRIVRNSMDVLDCEVDWLGQGFEGVMLRHPAAQYKFGRSTLREQILLKLKRFTDAEAQIIGYEPLFSNQNPQTRNSQGLAERSDHKAGLKQIETLGNLLVRDSGGRFGEFAIGSGFDAATRATIWSDREGLLGRTVTYKYQQIGVKDKPRFPIFLRFREAE